MNSKNLFMTPWLYFPPVLMWNSKPWKKPQTVLRGMNHIHLFFFFFLTNGHHRILIIFFFFQFPNVMPNALSKYGMSRISAHTPCLCFLDLSTLSLYITHCALQHRQRFLCSWRIIFNCYQHVKIILDLWGPRFGRTTQ